MTEPRKHLMWFVHRHFQMTDLSLVKEIFIDATYNTSKEATHLYAIVGNEYGYGIPLGFMLMEIGKKENTKSSKTVKEALNCNRNFYSKAKELGLEPTFVHTDKDWSEISASQVFPTLPIELEQFRVDRLQ
jgi:hypothetical protein